VADISKDEIVSVVDRQVFHNEKLSGDLVLHPAGNITRFNPRGIVRGQVIRTFLERELPDM
jgi:hypothetical protein